ncbi:MAG: dihydroorotate dehydrogenase electron transfer subunit [Thermodesulfobacteriota bacterium]
MSDTFLGEVEVIENRAVAADTFLLRLAAPAVAEAGRPGQFVMVRTGPPPEQGGLLLKRPFSLSRLGPRGQVWLLVRIVGAGTAWLARVRAGETLELLGPLGRGFDLDPPPRAAYLVAGGIGLAPLLALAEALPGETELHLLYGERTKANLAPEWLLELFAADSLDLSTDDGSAGRKGLVTDLLAEALGRKPAPVFACGPKPLLEAAAGLAARFGVPAQLSLEAHMACGLGACLGCVARTAGPEPAYARVCREGPVFKAEEVLW